MSDRIASVERNTLETQIKVSINLDGTGKFNCVTGVPFLDHMLEQVARHGLIDLDIHAVGDLTSMRIIRWKIWALRWVRRLILPWAIKKASNATVTLTCR